MNRLLLAILKWNVLTRNSLYNDVLLTVIYARITGVVINYAQLILHLSLQFSICLGYCHPEFVVLSHK